MTISPAVSLVGPARAERQPRLCDLTEEQIAQIAAAEAYREGAAGAVHSWELVTAVDGPGTRLTTFLAGCPLRCSYCHNPDTWSRSNGEFQSIEQVTERMRRYAPVLRAAGGGVTFSGGEPLAQAPFVARALRAAKDLGLHTALDTSGFLGSRCTDQMLADLDLVLLDIKSGLPERYREVTGRDLAPTLRFGQRLAEADVPVWVRFVLVPGLTDDEANVAAVAEHAAAIGSVERVEVLPFHTMGRAKWDAIGREYLLGDTQAPSAELLERVRDQFRAAGLATY